jgi:hypothetical protein
MLNCCTQTTLEAVSYPQRDVDTLTEVRILNAAASNVEVARTYTVIGSIITAVVGLILVWAGMSTIESTPAVLVFGFLSLFLGLAAYMTTSEKIRTGDLKGARTPCLLFGVLLVPFGAIIGGVFLLLAHSKLVEVPIEIQKRKKREPAGGGLTEETELVLLSPAGFLECQSGPDSGRSVAIRTLSMTVGRGSNRKTGGMNDLRLSEHDMSVSSAQGTIRVDKDTMRVSLRHESDTSKTFVDGGILVPGEWKELRNGSEIEFGTRGAKWRFVLAARRETESQT